VQFIGLRTMYVCICTGITDKAIRQAASDGVRCMSELTRRTGCAGTCGSCADFAQQVLADAQPTSHFSLPLIAAAG
jgi:bacterioferritin-associated ferredoxin